MIWCCFIQARISVQSLTPTERSVSFIFFLKLSLILSWARWDARHANAAQYALKRMRTGVGPPPGRSVQRGGAIPGVFPERHSSFQQQPVRKISFLFHDPFDPSSRVQTRGEFCRYTTVRRQLQVAAAARESSISPTKGGRRESPAPSSLPITPTRRGCRLSSGVLPGFPPGQLLLSIQPSLGYVFGYGTTCPEFLVSDPWWGSLIAAVDSLTLIQDQELQNSAEVEGPGHRGRRLGAGNWQPGRLLVQLRFLSGPRMKLDTCSNVLPQ